MSDTEKRPATSPADQIIAEIERRFPNWRSYRDLVDCIDCTLGFLRTDARSNDAEAEQLSGEILAELKSARRKFPGVNVTFAALVEEVGELATATFAESRGRVRKEAIQVAVMAMRMVLDGDHTFDQWRDSHGLDPLVSSNAKRA